MIFLRRYGIIDTVVKVYQKKGYSVKNIFSNDSLKLLNMLLMPIAAMLIITAFFYSSQSTYEAVKMYNLFCDMMESIVLSLVIAVGGSLLFDIELKRIGHSSSDKS